MKETTSVDITKAYQSASSQILTSLIGRNTQAIKLSFEKTLQTVVTRLDKLNADEISKAVRQGEASSRQKFINNLSEIFNGRAFTIKDLTDKGLDIKNKQTAEKILNKQTVDTEKNAVYRQSFLELRGQLVGVSKDLQRTVNGELHNLAKSDNNTVMSATKVIAERLRTQGVLNVKYGNGASVGVEKYATMVARSARTESANAENMKLSSEFGTDLVECVGNSITCDVCAQFRGRVFSISGNDKRYPPLRDGANSSLKNGYDLIHPNCRCEFRSYFEVLHTDQENKAKEAFSNRSVDGDKRTTAQARAYQDWQNVQRRALDEQYRYNEMKAVLGSDMQYADIGSLRRAMRSDKESFAYKKSHYAVRDYKQYARWKNIIGDNNLPKNLAEFQELKYNKIDKFEELKTETYSIPVREIIKRDYSLKIQADKQGKHIVGSRTYQVGKSRVYLSIQEAQDIVNQYACNGEIVFDRNFQWQHKERIVADKVIGCIEKNGKEVDTKLAMIHYSKNGTHIVPREEHK